MFIKYTTYRQGMAPVIIWGFSPMYFKYLLIIAKILMRAPPMSIFRLGTPLV